MRRRQIMDIEKRINHRYKQIAMVLLPCVFASTLAIAQKNTRAKATPCMENAVTQYDMNSCAGKNLEDEDLELKKVYQQVLKKYASDATLVSKLKASQRAWIAFRDAEMDARFPNPNGYGSVFPMCDADIKADLTKERTKQLRVWLEGIEEGDVCTDAIATRERK
jgi:uncharacterized protein YecT (DUF1311 family)